MFVMSEKMEPSSEQDQIKQPVLQIRNLSLVRDILEQEMVVRDLSLSVQRGQVIALTGEDGAGMSAVAWAAAALFFYQGLKVKQGEICLMGEDMLKMSTGRLRRLRQSRVAYVGRQTMDTLNPCCSIRQHLLEVAAWKSWPELESGQNLIQALYEVGLAEPESVLDRLPGQLSAEALCRVVIAMALQAGVDLIVVNEMTAHLDATVEQQILELLVDLKNRQRLSMLLVTHHPGIIEALADEVVVMFGGRVVEQGKVSEVLLAGQHPYIKALISCAPRLGERRHRLGEISEADRQAAGKIVT